MSLDQKTLDELKHALTEEKSRLEAELLRFAKPTGTDGDYQTRFDDIGTDAEDNATEVETYVDNLGLESNLENQLKEVNDALAKMTAGTYGLCEKTGKEISLERLRAYPAARTAL